MRADRADQFRSTTYGKVLSGSRFDMVPSVPLGGYEDRPSPANTIEGRSQFAILTIWNAAIYCTLVVRDSLIVSLR
jgi:hypothetical protein